MLRKKQESEYEKHAREFAEKIGLTMTAVYLGHYPRLGKHITANYRITLTRTGRAPFMFDFSTSINDSWFYRDGAHVCDGLPARIDLDKFFATVPSVPFQYHGVWIDHRKRAPSLYDVLACLTKYEPGTFNNFCADYGYSNDSISARDTWQAVIEEYENVHRLFSDVMEELTEIQ